MQEPSGMEGPSGRPTGGRAVLGAAMAIVGALAAVQPTNVLLGVLAQEVPRLAAALPPVLTACGAILAAVSEPPGRVRKD